MSKNHIRSAVRRAMSDKKLVARAAKDAAESVVRSKAFSEAYKAADENDDTGEHEPVSESPSAPSPMRATGLSGATPASIANATKRG